MLDYDGALQEILKLTFERAETRKQLNDTVQDNVPFFNEQREALDRISDAINDFDRRLRGLLTDLVRFPPHHIQYKQLIQQFCTATSCEKSVFVMTKYPDGKDAKKDKELQRVIDTVVDTVAQCGFVPHLASEKKYHQNLWENVEVHMLCCRRGIAIVENRYKPQLNPNVAMEWGWMRAMGKRVLYLVDKGFKLPSADTGALIQARFSWDDPQRDIAKAVQQELAQPSP